MTVRVGINCFGRIGRNFFRAVQASNAVGTTDIEIVAAVAPGADIRVYFAPNTDAGFEHAVEQALAECHAVSVSWRGP